MNLPQLNNQYKKELQRYKKLSAKLDKLAKSKYSDFEYNQVSRSMDESANKMASLAVEIELKEKIK